MYKKLSYAMIEVTLLQRCKDSSIFSSPKCDEPLTKGMVKMPHDPLSRCRKISPNSTPIYDKGPEHGHRGSIPQHDKEHIRKTHG